MQNCNFACHFAWVQNFAFTLREEHTLRLSESRVLREVFGTRRDEVTGEWKRLHNDGLKDLHCSPNIIWVSK